MILTGFEKIVEERIRDAQRRGEFDDLPGSGKPLELQDDSLIPEEMRLAYKILKNSGFTPPEIELKKEISRTEDLLTGLGDAAGKYRVLKKLNFLIMKLNLMRGAPIMSELPQHYVAKLADRLEPESVPSHPNSKQEKSSNR